jgi:hypothetical protein
MGTEEGLRRRTAGGEAGRAAMRKGRGVSPLAPRATRAAVGGGAARPPPPGPGLAGLRVSPQAEEPGARSPLPARQDAC